MLREQGKNIESCRKKLQTPVKAISSEKQIIQKKF
jgi:hypothetical protein